LKRTDRHNSQREKNMKHGSDSGGVIVAIALILILFLLIGGAATYFAFARQQAAMAREAALAQAQVAEAQARFQVEQARAAAEREVVSRTIGVDQESSADQEVSIRAAVESILRDQEEAWNHGNLDAFMEHYWKSDALAFSSGGKTTRGWTETLDRYRERYSTPDKMGRLMLSDLEITPLGDSAALVLGQWNLQRESEPVSGNFSLVLRKFNDRWLIVHDHTSRMTDD
jgi:beta-aspartyl-peptidase (threonine type)